MNESEPYEDPKVRTQRVAATAYRRARVAYNNVRLWRANPRCATSPLYSTQMHAVSDLQSAARTAHQLSRLDDLDDDLAAVAAVTVDYWTELTFSTLGRCRGYGRDR